MYLQVDWQDYEKLLAMPSVGIRCRPTAGSAGRYHPDLVKGKPLTAVAQRSHQMLPPD